MEALVVALFALGAIVLLEAVYAMAISLARWAPVIAIGALACWAAHHHGVAPPEALGVAILFSLLTRHMLRRAFF